MKKMTITIGIPAHNEEKNIERLVHSIFSQKSGNYILEKVIVACDGCTDDTALVVEKLQKKYKKIMLINDNNRLGKSVRLNNFYKICESDLFITFDADVVLFNDSVLIELVKQFKNKSVGLAAGISIPFMGNTLIEKAQYAYDLFWNDVVYHINKGNNIHSHKGRISAGRSTVLKSLEIPHDIVAEDHYLYIAIHKLGYTFKCAKNAFVCYKTPATLYDYVLQMTRFLESKKNIDDYFGHTSSYYNISRRLKLKMYVKHFTVNPLYMSIALAINAYQRSIQLLYSKNNSNKWDVVLTTK